MKTLLKALVIIFIICSASPVLADLYLSCDNYTVTPEQSIVEVDGIEHVGIAQPWSQDQTVLLLLNLTAAGLDTGLHTFRAKVRSNGELWSDFSVPFVPGKQDAPGGFSIVED